MPIAAPGRPSPSPAYAASTCSQTPAASHRPRSQAPDRPMRSTSCRPWPRRRTPRRGRARQGEAGRRRRPASPQLEVEDLHCLLHRGVGVLRRDDDPLPGSELARGRQRDESRRRRRVLDVAVPAGRQPEQLRHPVEHDALQLGRGRRRAPEDRVLVERGREELREDRGLRARDARSTRRTAGDCQCVIAGRRISSTSFSTAENGSPCSGAVAGSRERTYPGSTCASTGSSPTRSR